MLDHSPAAALFLDTLSRSRQGRDWQGQPYRLRVGSGVHRCGIAGWLDGTLGQDSLRPAAESALREWTVSKRVNRTSIGDDEPTIVEPEVQVA